MNNIFQFNYNCLPSTTFPYIMVSKTAKKDKTTKTTEEAVTCQSTIGACALLSLDAICCIPCCMCFGGCCGKYEPFATKAFGGIELKEIKPGHERFQTVCFVQCLSAILMPFTCCGCCWACCGTCAPCAIGVIKSINGHEEHKIIPTDSTKPPIDQIIERVVLDFAK
jgi:hypothetical protein